MSRILITSALPYINGVKHLGNVVGSMLPSDAYARYLRQRGHEVMFICATDEHGTPAELAAAEAGQPVAEYCAEMHEVQKGLGEGFGLSFDYFGRSSSQRNHALTQDFAGKLAEAGLVREVSEQQVYSNADGRFLPDRYIIGTCPNCGFDRARGDQCENCTKQLNPTDLIDPRSSISGSTDLEVRETKHLYLFGDLAQISGAEPGVGLRLRREVQIDVEAAGGGAQRCVPQIGHDPADLISDGVHHQSLRKERGHAKRHGAKRNFVFGGVAGRRTTRKAGPASIGKKDTPAPDGLHSIADGHGCFAGRRRQSQVQLLAGRSKGDRCPIHPRFQNGQVLNFERPAGHCRWAEHHCRAGNAGLRVDVETGGHDISTPILDRGPADRIIDDRDHEPLVSGLPSLVLNFEGEFEPPRRFRPTG